MDNKDIVNKMYLKRIRTGKEGIIINFDEPLCLMIAEKARQEGLIDAINVIQKKADYFNKRISQGIAYNFDEMKIKWTAHYNLCLQLVNKLKELKSKDE